MLKEVDKMEENIKDFVEFVSDKEAIAKPVIIDDELKGWIIWKGGHTLNFFDVDFKEIDVRNVGDFEKEGITFNEFLDEANEWINEIEKEFKE